MTQLDKLLMLWEDGSIDEEQMKELKELLQDPENREELYNFLHTSETLSDVFKEEKSLKKSSKKFRNVKKVKVSPRKKPIPFWKYAVAACALFAVGLAVFVNNRKSVDDNSLWARVSAVSGEVSLKNSRQPANINDWLKPGQKIVTGSKSQLVLTYPDSTEIILAENSECEIVENNVNSKHLRLVEGTATVTVAKQAVNSPMKVFAGESLTTVRGTRFTLKTDAKETRLDLEKGKVDFALKNEKSVLKLEAGNYVTVKDGKVLGLFLNNTEKVPFTSMSLLDSDINQVVKGYENLPLESKISLKSLSGIKKFNILLTAPKEVKLYQLSVYFQAPGGEEKVLTKKFYEQQPPFTMFDDRPGDHPDDNESLRLGTYRFIIQGLAAKNKPVGKAVTSKLTFVE